MKKSLKKGLLARDNNVCGKIIKKTTKQAVDISLYTVHSLRDKVLHVNHQAHKDEVAF